MELADEVGDLDEVGSPPSRAASSSPPFSRSSGGIELVAEEPVQLLLVPKRCTSPVSTTVTPYSETEKPRRCASSRSATLWSFEPVKCCSRLP